jgi:ribonucleoside-diphosphate reductase alpha chain
MNELGNFAETIFKRTYAFDDSETWEGCARRVSKFVANGDKKLENEFFRVISTRKFIPGGRYLAQCGRDVPQLTNCFLLKAEDSREGWAEVLYKSFMALSTGGGIGCEYCLGLGTKVLTEDLKWVPVEKLALGQRIVAFNEDFEGKGADKIRLEPGVVTSARQIMRPCYEIITDRGNIIASAEHKFVARKRIRLDKQPKKRKEAYRWVESKELESGYEIAFSSEPWEQRYTYDEGWMAGILDGEGWISSGAKNNRSAVLGVAQSEGPILDKIQELFACNEIEYGTYLQNSTGNKKVYTVQPKGKWNRLKTLGLFRPTRLLARSNEVWDGMKWHGKSNRAAIVCDVKYLGEMPVVALGTSTKTVIADGFLSHNSSVRERGQPIKRFGGTTSGPIALMSSVNETARHVMSGGKRRSALWAGLAWYHPDIEEFIQIKNWSTKFKAMKEEDFNFPAPLDMTNISVRLTDSFFKRAPKDEKTWDLYYRICKMMLKTGEPGFSIDVGENKDQILRNPCTEVVSDTDSDCCNLGSINLGRIADTNELEEVTRIAVRFLYNGTFVSWLPHTTFEQVREKYRRIGLGIMGLHEWCIRNDQRYETTGRLGKWLSVWQGASDDEADKYSKELNGVRPIAVRAVAPTGTIGIIGETTTGIEPMYCVAYKRRWRDNNGKYKFQHVIDPTAARLAKELSVEPDSFDDSVKLSMDVERRISMQAFVQDFVDQAISSTINVPEWGEPGNANAKQFSETLFRYLPKLRGITVYPDGARAGQPITAVKYETAKRHENVVFEEDEDRCAGGVCGI